MKAMKSMSGVNKVFGSFKRKHGPPNTPPEPANNGNDTPEANAVRNLRLFCESGGPNGSGEEVLYLPAIVEACESSPAAAKESATLVRKFLSKEYIDRPYMQYNAIMVTRILADNPGPTFTRNMDSKFVQTVKELLRYGSDPSVKQILIETLDTFQREKAGDEGCAMLIEMWKKEHGKMMKTHGPSPISIPPPVMYGAQGGGGQNYFSRNHNSKHLPPPHELSSRIEEARTTAQLLTQTVQSTPPSELLQNELVLEFADRCQSASRSVQTYMVAENPAPDNDTMLTLIETNETVNKAIMNHQRAILNARKVAGLGNAPIPPPRTESGFAPPPASPPPRRRPARKSVQPPIPPPGDYAPVGEEEDPFADPKAPPFPKDRRSEITGQFNDNLGVEPYHPGFKGTDSYADRQESSVERVTMSTAIGDDESTGERSGYGVAGDGKAPIYRY